MTTSQMTVDYILEQISEAGAVNAKKVFGGYCLYCDGMVKHDDKNPSRLSISMVL